MLSVMTLRESLAHAWVTVGVPGTTHPHGSTYVSYPAERLPTLPTALSEGDGLGWLRSLPTIGSGMTPDEFSYATTAMSREGVQRLLQAAGTQVPFEQLPGDLRAFASERELHRRLYSATDSYVDAGEHLEPVVGGHLLHLVSDSQWVFHWLAFIGNDGSTGVVCSANPLGYVADEAEAGAPSQGVGEPVWVADSVAGFVWRWWADNYAFAAAHPDLCPPLLAPDWFDLAAYTAGYTAAATETD